MNGLFLSIKTTISFVVISEADTLQFCRFLLPKNLFVPLFMDFRTKIDSGEQGKVKFLGSTFNSWLTKKYAGVHGYETLGSVDIGYSLEFKITSTSITRVFNDSKVN